MSFANPTPIQIGMWGTFNGVRYRVAGRIVLGCDVDGQRYYWNEFHLVSQSGEEATLVHEEGENGIEWRMFVLFEPEYPLTAADAATKRVGDYLNLEGTAVRITLVDESRVYLIEGEAPEGVDRGDVANYFNAKSGRDMIVVSWTGDEIEYYRGRDLTGGMVASSFDLHGTEFSHFIDPFRNVSALSDSSEITSKRMLQGILGVLLVALFFVGNMTCRTSRRTKIITKAPAAAAPFPFGATALLEGKTWLVRAHVIVEIGQTGQLFDRHEYHLTDADGNAAWLVCGMQPDDKDWIWFIPLDPVNPPTPTQAAALKSGDTINVDGWIGPVTELFQAINRQISSDLSEVREGEMQFGFTVRSGTTLIQTRWDAHRIVFLRGTAMSATAVKNAFAKN